MVTEAKAIDQWTDVVETRAKDQWRRLRNARSSSWARRRELGREIRAKARFLQHTARAIEAHVAAAIADPNFDSAGGEVQGAFSLELVGCIAGREHFNTDLGGNDERIWIRGLGVAIGMKPTSIGNFDSLASDDLRLNRGFTAQALNEHSSDFGRFKIVRLRGSRAHEDFAVAVGLDAEILVLIEQRVVEDLLPAFEQKSLLGGKAYGAHGVDSEDVFTWGLSGWPKPL